MGGGNPGGGCINGKQTIYIKGVLNTKRIENFKYVIIN